MSVTIREVADRAGVSLSTASLVLQARPDPRITKATQQRVLRAAKELNYRPNLAARSLRSRKTLVVGMVMTRLQWHDCLELAYPVEQFFRERNYHIMMGFSHSDPAEEQRYVEEMLSGRVDGILVQPVRLLDQDLLEFYRTLKIPIVLLDGPDGSGLPSVKKDRQAGVRLCVRHLHGLGRRKIALAFISEDFFSGRERLEGYRQGLAERGLPFDPSLVLPGGSSGDYFKEGSLLAEEVRARGADIDAVICANDFYAIGLMHGLRELGVDVPREVSVLGFTNLPASQYHSTPLTTVEQHYERTARTAAEMLWELIHLPDDATALPPRTVVIEPELIVRESCGATLFSRSALKPSS